MYKYKSLSVIVLFSSLLSSACFSCIVTFSESLRGLQGATISLGSKTEQNGKKSQNKKKKKMKFPHGRIVCPL